MWSDRDINETAMHDEFDQGPQRATGRQSRPDRGPDRPPQVRPSRSGDRDRYENREAQAGNGRRGRRSGAQPLPTADQQRYSDLLRQDDQIGRPIKVWY
jgi:hypothetical protein